MDKRQIKKAPSSLALCLACGLCCNGVIFSDVRLRGDDKVALKKVVGCELRKRRPGRLAQPCQFLDKRQCTVYRHRPGYCREFECALLKKVMGGELTTESALHMVHATLSKVRHVEKALCSLGDTHDTMPLRIRFQKTLRKLQSSRVDLRGAVHVSELTLTMHNLTCTLSRTFYPGE